MSGPYSTLFELNLHQTLKLIGMALYEDKDHEGLQLLFNALTEDVQDDKYNERLAELKELAGEVPEGKMPHEWNRELNFKHLAAMVSCIRRHGYLDSAPTAESDAGVGWLSEA